MKEKKKYIQPNIETIELEGQDVIATSFKTNGLQKEENGNSLFGNFFELFGNE